MKLWEALIYMYSAVIGVLEVIRDDGSDWKAKGDARGLLLVMKTFQFVFSLHLMKTVLAITNELSQALQRKEQDIVNALNLVELSKTRLQIMRVSGWNSFLDEVALFCGKHQINVPDMNDKYRIEGGSKRVGGNISNLRYYEVDLFNSILDMQLQELNNRFNEKNSRLLICMACLNPNDSFSTFDKEKLLELADFYPNDFSEAQRKIFLGDQLDMFILDMRSSSQFTELRGLGSLAQKMAETKRNEVYPLIYKLIKLVLVLPVATATVERVFSAMTILKNRLRNRMGDQFLNDSMIVYIESEKFKSISNEAIVQRYHTMKKRREQL